MPATSSSAASQRPRYPTAVQLLVALLVAVPCGVYGALGGAPVLKPGSTPAPQPSIEELLPKLRGLQQAEGCPSTAFWSTIQPSATPVSKNTTAISSSFVGACSSAANVFQGVPHVDACGASRNLVAAAWTLGPAATQDRMITLSTCGLTSVDTVITVRRGCDATASVVACNNDAGNVTGLTGCGTRGSGLTFTAAAGQTYTVFVQAVSAQACWAPSVSILVALPTPVPAVLSACPAASNWWSLTAQPPTVITQAFADRLGPACPASTSTSEQQGVVHAPACADVAAADAPLAAAWTFVATAAQSVTVMTCTPAADGLVPLLTVREGCSTTSVLMACSSGASVNASCGRMTSVDFNVRAGEMYTVFAQAANNTGCWRQPGITLTPTAYAARVPPPPPPPRYVVVPAPPPPPGGAVNGATTAGDNSDITVGPNKTLWIVVAVVSVAAVAAVSAVAAVCKSYRKHRRAARAANTASHPSAGAGSDGDAGGTSTAHCGLRAGLVGAQHKPCGGAHSASESEAGSARTSDNGTPASTPWSQGKEGGLSPSAAKVPMDLLHAIAQLQTHQEASPPHGSPTSAYPSEGTLQPHPSHPSQPSQSPQPDLPPPHSLRIPALRPPHYPPI